MILPLGSQTLQHHFLLLIHDTFKDMTHIQKSHCIFTDIFRHGKLATGVPKPRRYRQLRLTISEFSLVVPEY